MSKGGVTLIVLGSLFLANNFGLRKWGRLRQWRPLLQVEVSADSIFDHKPGDRRPSQDADKKT
jgi:hypothetical protein